VLTAQVDLGQVQTVGSVKIWGRGDCCQDRLDGFSVYVGNSPASYDANSSCFTGGVAPLTSPYTVLCVCGRGGGCVRLLARERMVGFCVRFLERLLGL
jgi:hypothetical protein